MNEFEHLEKEYNRLKAKEKKSMLNEVLSPLLQAWDKAAKHYSEEAEKQPNLYMKGKREGASYKLESCANELRALIEEVGR